MTQNTIFSVVSILNLYNKPYQIPLHKSLRQEHILTLDFDKVSFKVIESLTNPQAHNGLSTCSVATQSEILRGLLILGKQMRVSDRRMLESPLTLLGPGRAFI